MSGLQFYDKTGFPVERIHGKPLANFIRLLLHTNIRVTWHEWKGTL